MISTIQGWLHLTFSMTQILQNGGAPSWKDVATEESPCHHYKKIWKTQEKHKGPFAHNPSLELMLTKITGRINMYLLYKKTLACSRLVAGGNLLNPSSIKILFRWTETRIHLNMCEVSLTLLPTSGRGEIRTHQLKIWTTQNAYLLYIPDPQSLTK